MSIIQSDLLLGQEGSSKYQVSRSLRFNSADTSFLSRNFPSSGDRKKWTWSGWVKRSKIGVDQALFSAPQSGGYPSGGIYFNSSDQLRLFGNDASSNTIVNKITSAVYRDTSAWMHVVVAVDFGNAQAKLYVNGAEITAFSTNVNPIDTDGPINSGSTIHAIGQFSNTFYFNGLMADIWFLDGIAATPSDFAETDSTTGQWIPKVYAGSKPGNSFHLDFSDNSAATAAALGKDSSGNGLNWTPNNFVASAPTVSPLLTSTNTGQFGSFFTETLSDSWGFNYTVGQELKLDFGSAVQVTEATSLTRPSYDDTGQWKFQSSTDGVNWTDRSTITSFSSSQLISWGTGNATARYWRWVQTAENFNYSLNLVAISITANGTTYISAGNPNRSGTVLQQQQNPRDVDLLVDTPTSYGTDDSLGGSVRGNYCTLNPLANGLNLTNGNLDFDIGARVDWKTTTGTYYPSSGKWYWEVTTATQNTSGANIAYGIRTISSTSSFTNELGYNDSNYAYFASGGKRVGNTASIASYGASYTTGDVIGVALDMDAGTLTMYKNGSSQGTLTTGLTGSWTPAFGVYTGGTQVGTSSFSVNFGQRPWAYTPPANHRPLVDTLLPSPSVAKPSTVMDVKLYTGNASTNAITGLGFSPDLVWAKSRSAATNHGLIDTVRGRAFVLISDSTVAEQNSPAGNDLASFDANGFTLGTNNAMTLNTSGATYVAWAWDAGSSTVTNTQGSITCQLRANATSGFSVATFTGATTGTIGHGLGIAPSMIIMKARTSNPGANDWFVYHKDVGNTKALLLNSTAAPNTYTYWNNTSPTSTVFSIGSGLGTPDWVAYCFAPVAGYSSFGSYVGNGSSDGPAIWLGFRPALLIIKNSSATNNWVIFDNKRDGYNVNNDQLYPNTSAAEDDGLTYTFVDLLSNGFKLRNTATDKNGSGGTYIYCAWAENPFQYARAR